MSESVRIILIAGPGHGLVFTVHPDVLGSEQVLHLDHIYERADDPDTGEFLGAYIWRNNQKDRS